MKELIVIISLSVICMGSLFSQTTRSAEEASGLQTGIKAPLFMASDAEGNSFSLEETLQKGPVVLIFYRGQWCPVCNKHLGQVQDSLSLITELGATVVAVSPEKPDYLKKTEEKTGASFRLLYDESYRIADAYDVTFTPEKKQLFVYNTVLNANLKEAQSDNSQRLPIPATYIIDKKGYIIWRQFDPDYKNRSNVQDIIVALKDRTALQ
ncbi:MAG: AhpC/TSA family protein [Bacteroidia bacterium]|nr:MAG: AhpC/TSA family protein [Bacteroidia bacterium]